MTITSGWAATFIKRPQGSPVAFGGGHNDLQLCPEMAWPDEIGQQELSCRRSLTKPVHVEEAAGQRGPQRKVRLFIVDGVTGPPFPPGFLTCARTGRMYRMT